MQKQCSLSLSSIYILGYFSHLSKAFFRCAPEGFSGARNSPKFGVCANLGKTSVKTPLTPKKTCHADTNLSGADTEKTRAIGEELVRQCLRGVKSCTSEPVLTGVRHQRMKNAVGALFFRCRKTKEVGVFPTRHRKRGATFRPKFSYGRKAVPWRRC